MHADPTRVDSSKNNASQTTLNHVLLIPVATQHFLPGSTRAKIFTKCRILTSWSKVLKQKQFEQPIFAIPQIFKNFSEKPWKQRLGNNSPEITNNNVETKPYKNRNCKRILKSYQSLTYLNTAFSLKAIIG